MPLAFSFFTSKRPAKSPQTSSDTETVQTSQLVEHEAHTSEDTSLFKNPFPVQKPLYHSEPASEASEALGPAAECATAATLILPARSSSESTPHVDLSENRGSIKGLAALVVNQSAKEAPPLNRQRPPTFPISALAGEMPPFPEATLVQLTAEHQDQSALPETDILQDELHHEIEQVKNDLFGAVMGVSALKDRLDGLEAQLSQIQSGQGAGPPSIASHAEISVWMTAWLEEHLPEAIERALATVQEQALSTMSTAAYFRTTTRLSDTDRQSFLNHPPVILTSTPV